MLPLVCQPEINELYDIAVLAQKEKILGFQVSVGDFIGVQIANCLDHLFKNGPCIIFGKVALDVNFIEKLSSLT